LAKTKKYVTSTLVVVHPQKELAALQHHSLLEYSLAYIDHVSTIATSELLFRAQRKIGRAKVPLL
jgi:hypothetical protein